MQPIDISNQFGSWLNITKAFNKTCMKNKIELLAPAGNMEKLKTAFHFGADAVYLAGKEFGLRAFSDNFSHEEIVEAVQYAHSLNKKVYVTLNIYARNADFENLKAYLQHLQFAQVDAVLVSDLGIFDFVKNNSNLNIHISTQANTTNKYAVNFYKKLGAQRVVLARELTLDDICEINKFSPEIELEAFVHGAMCISYSGRCLLSNYLTGRDSNKGECVQACRWDWQLSKPDDQGQKFDLKEDERGTYIFNSKDLNLICHLDKLMQAGVVSFKIEGRMKSPFYVATVVNAYRRAIDECLSKGDNFTVPSELTEELLKVSHRSYTTGFVVDDGKLRQYYPSSRTIETSKFIAMVLDYKDGIATIEQRNKFVAGQTLEILSSGSSHNKQFVVDDITDSQGNKVQICNIVQQILKFPCPYPLSAGDILRN